MNGTNSSGKHYDMVVIGSGAAGHHAAVQAAKLGKKIAVVERSIALGGASINTGTIPSKALGRLSCVLPDQGPRIGGSRTRCDCDREGIRDSVTPSGTRSTSC